VNPARLRLIGLWTWFSGQRGTFAHDLIDKPWTPDMRVGAAVAAASDWRTTIDLHLYLGREPIGDMWLAPAHVGGYDFLPLNSIAAIAQEAVAMRNCVRTYGSNLAHNHSRLWSVRRDGERVATLRVAARYQDPLLNILELKGIGNAEAPRELWWAARRWLHMHDLSQIDVKQQYRSKVAMDRATWLSLWRPYWLAKRRIPEWLPIAPSRKVLEAL
jgi:hypothetical protein